MPHSDDLDTVARFNDRAADYVKYRPTYPPEAVRAILEGLGPPEPLVAADVGAGTGISARLLGDEGVRVVAVEPGEDMRRAAAHHPHVLWVSGKAEATGLRSETFDLVLCAQAFHWFRPPDALAEFARILKRGRRLAIVWNRRSKKDPFTAAYRQAIFAVAGEVGAESMSFDPDVVAGSGLFSAPERLVFPNSQRFDLDGFIGRARSASYVPKTGAEGARMLELLRGLYDRYADADGRVTMVYETEIFRARKL